jgi:hypothetical protein
MGASSKILSEIFLKSHEQGKPSERMGRKASGLKVVSLSITKLLMVAGLPMDLAISDVMNPDIFLT